MIGSIRAGALGVAALVCGGLALAQAGPAQAHDAKHHVVPKERVELSFGRTPDYDYEPPAPGSYRLPAIRPAGDGAVLDTEGRQRRLHELFEGRLTVLAFIYTRCSDPQGCPLSIGLLYDLLYVSQEDPAIGDNLRLLALSFDHEHDTPAVLAGLAGDEDPARAAGSDVTFLTTASQADLDPILESYDQPIGRKADAADPFGPFTHQLRVYLIDRRGEIRNIYSLGFLDPRLVITDIRTLLLEELRGVPKG